MSVYWVSYVVMSGVSAAGVCERMNVSTTMLYNKSVQGEQIRAHACGISGYLYRDRDRNECQGEKNMRICVISTQKK